MLRLYFRVGRRNHALNIEHRTLESKVTLFRGVVVLAGLARQRVFHANILIPMLLVAVTSVVHGLVLGFLRGDLPSGWTIPIQAAVHALLIPVIYLALRVFGR